MNSIQTNRIQEYCHLHKRIDIREFKPRIVSISGQLGNGKGEVFNLLNDIIRNFSDVHVKVENQEIIPISYPAFQEKRFADYLKSMVSDLTGIPKEDLDKFDVKSSLLPYIWDDKYEDGERKSITVRDLLTRIGNEMGRSVHPDIWCIATLSKFDANIHNWCITDMRYPNEKEWINNLGGLTIRVVRKMTFKEWSTFYDFDSWINKVESHLFAFKEVINLDSQITSEDFFNLIYTFSDKVSLVGASEKAISSLKASKNPSETSLKNSDKYGIVLYNTGTLEELRDELYIKLLDYTTYRSL